MSYQNKKIYKNKRKYLLFSTVLAVLLVLIVTFFIVKSNINADPLVPAAEQYPQTTSTAPTAQEDFSDGNEREPGNTLQEDKGSGTITTIDASNESLPDKSSWAASDSGDITVYSPAKNSSIKSGDKLRGSATTSTVNFRLIDNISGVIAQGELKVIDSDFAGVFNFDTNATEGRLDIFSFNNEGLENNNIEIPITFK